MPAFQPAQIALHPEDLKYAPNNDLVHPTIIRTEGRVQNPLGKYYLYYAPHKHVAISMAYADSPAGPWTEYENNPVIEGPSAPDIRWIAEHRRFFMWGHRKNSQTEAWTSQDGIRFKYHSVSVSAKNIGTRNASYSRVYAYPLAKHRSRYIMLYSGFIEARGIRCIWLAHSKDAIKWTQEKTPLIEPIAGEMKDCYGPAFLRWQGKNYITYQDHTAWRGGNLKYVELDQALSPVGPGGKRWTLIAPPAAPPLHNRLRGSELHLIHGQLHLISSASQNPRLLVHAQAKPAHPKNPKTD